MDTEEITWVHTGKTGCVERGVPVESLALVTLGCAGVVVR